jgi:hypothetical protein
VLVSLIATGAVALEQFRSQYRALLRDRQEPARLGVPVTGELMRSFGSDADVASRIQSRARELDAGAIVVGPETSHGMRPRPWRRDLPNGRRLT